MSAAAATGTSTAAAMPGSVSMKYSTLVMLASGTTKSVLLVAVPPL